MTLRPPVLTPDRLTGIAMELVDERGPAGLTLKAVADRASVASPSLYNHVGGLKELRELVTLRVMREVTERLTSAVLGLARDDAVRELMHSFRQFVLQHPHRYALLDPDPLASPALQAEGQKQMGVFAGILRGYGLTGSAEIHAIRHLRTIGHGFASIESTGGFGLKEDTDETFRQQVEMLVAWLNSKTAPSINHERRNQ